VLGELLSLLSAIAWAVGVILYRRLGRTLAPLPLNFLKNCLVLAMLVPVALVVEGMRWPTLPPADLAIALGSGVIGIALADTLYFRALNELGAGRVGVIGNLYSPFVIVLSFVFLGERLGALQVGGFVLVSAGVLLVAKPAGDADPARPAHRVRGVLLGIAAIALMAVAIVMVKRTLETQPLFWVTLARLVGALLGLLAVAAATGELRRLLPRGARFDWRVLVLAAFVGQGLAMLLWLAGYKYTDASIAAILNESASVFILLLAWLWLHEPLGRRGALGVTLTLSGVALMLL
jgi:drug/metabolite transporter (DMT)-like permease